MTREKASALVSENLKVLYAWALSRVSDRQDAEDLCSDVCLAVIENAPGLRYDDAFFGWFWQIAKNTYSVFLKNRSKNTHSDIESSPDIADSDTPESMTVKKESYNTLYREVALLAKHHRECSVDYYFNGLSVKEIGEKYSLSSESVKYYLFKTRKILKEGISMERQFGEKSFNPTPFYFRTFYNGNVSAEFDNLFAQRKLPGQILSTAYYTPMSVSELCLELGVPSVYLEDEITVLLDYELLKKVGDKYQTQILLMDEGFFGEVWNECEKQYRNEAAMIAKGLSEKLEKIREIGFVGNNLDGELILWDCLVLALTTAYERIPTPPFKQKLCGETVGFCYGVTCDRKDMPDMRRVAIHLAGQYNGDDGRAMRFLMFGDNSGTMNPDFPRIDEFYDLCKASPENTVIPGIYEDEREKLISLIEEDIDNAVKLLKNCNAVCTKCLASRAPEGIEVNEGTTFLANILFIFSMAATLCEEEGLTYPEDKHPGIIALK